MPLTHELSFTGLDEFVNKHVVENYKAKSSKEEPKVVRKNNDALIIEEWVSDNKEKDVSQPKIEKKTDTPQIDLQDQGVINSGCSRHMTGNMSYLTYYEEIDGGYISFGGNPKGGKSQEKVPLKLPYEEKYCLFVTNEYSRFTWVFFLATKDETSGILKSFITRIKNLVDHKVKVIRCDNRTEFKNREMDQFCEMKGILRQFSVVRTPQQNKVAERRNRTLIKAARTMLADSKLPTTFWAEAVNTACYVQNRVLVVKPHNKTPYELFHSRTPTLSFMRLFRCPITILNTIDHLGKFSDKPYEGFFVGFSLNSKAFRVFNSKTRIAEENLHIMFSESTPNVLGSGSDWLFNIDALTRTMNYEPTVIGTQSNGFAGTKASDNAGQARKETEPVKNYILLPLWTTNLPFSLDPKSSYDDGSKPSCDDGKKDLKIQTFLIEYKRLKKHCMDYIKLRELEVKTANTPMETQKPLLKDKDGEEGDFHMYRLMIGSLMYLISSRPGIMFVVCNCTRHQVNLKVSHLHAMKKIFRRDLQLEDEEGIDCLPNSTILEQLALMGPNESVADEAVHKELGNNLVRAATTASSLEAEHDNGNITKTQYKATPNEPSSKGTNLCGGPRCKETMGIQLLKLVGLSARVESSGDKVSFGEDASKEGMRIDVIDADQYITLVNDADKKMFNVDNLGGEEVFVVRKNENVVEEVVNVAQVSTATTIVTITTEEITLAQALEALKNSKPKVKGIVFQELEKAELKQLKETIPDEEEVAIDVIPLVVKSSRIIDWKIHKAGKKSYYQIVRADEKYQMYMIFSQMFKNFDREEVSSYTTYTFNDARKKLQIDYESKMAYQLCKLIKKQLKNLRNVWKYPPGDDGVSAASELQRKYVKCLLLLLHISTASAKLVLLVQKLRLLVKLLLLVKLQLLVLS
nr:ribonuclease H-like domain-containing protein [Tanacetum cinerariifolium]